MVGGDGQWFHHLKDNIIQDYVTVEGSGHDYNGPTQLVQTDGFSRIY